VTTQLEHRLDFATSTTSAPAFASTSIKTSTTANTAPQMTASVDDLTTCRR
jgi:hypothetical protein